MKPVLTTAAELRPIAYGMPAFSELSAEILHAGKALRFRAHGSSMQPLVRDGDVLRIEPLDERPPKPGEVVLCNQQPGSVVVHRVVHRQAGPDGMRYTIQGDQVGQPDGSLPLAQIHGRLVSLEHAGKVIPLQGLPAILLGWLAVLRSRSSLGRGQSLQFIKHLARRLPVVSTFLT